MSTRASSLKHPNIIPVNLFIEDKGCVYVEFPLYDMDMEEWLKDNPSHPDVHASAHDILRAIEHMHRAKVVHCDIRPKNILMKQRVGVAAADGATGRWQATLADFDVSLNSGARATIWQTRTEGPRGFDGMLTMAPELRAPLFQGCTPASDMFSFGGLLYVALYPQISPAMVKTSDNGDIEVGAHEIVDVAPLVRSLLQKDSKGRPSASEALAHPLFAAAGANLLAQVQEQQREFARQQEQHCREEEAAKRELAKEFREVQKKEQKLEQEQERLQRNSSAQKQKDRQQQEKEKRLGEQLERLRKEKASLRDRQKQEEKARQEKQARLDEQGEKERESVCVCVRACARACGLKNRFLVFGAPRVGFTVDAHCTHRAESATRSAKTGKGRPHASGALEPRCCQRRQTASGQGVQP